MAKSGTTRCTQQILYLIATYNYFDKSQAGVIVLNLKILSLKQWAGDLISWYILLLNAPTFYEKKQLGDN